MPSISIGTTDGPPEYQLASVRGVVELSNGRIVVANGGTMSILCYERDGRFAWASGRRGQGPGDFWTLSRIAHYPGDSILVHDFGQRRYSLIGPDGTYTRSWTMTPPDDTTTVSSLHLVGVFADGTMAVLSTPPRRGRSQATVTRAPTRLFRYGATGKVLNTLGSFPGEEYYEGKGFDIRRLPFARSTRFATSDSSVYAGTDDTYEIRQLDWNGRLAILVRRAAPAQTISESEMEMERERLRSERARERSRRFRGMPDSILNQMVIDEERMFAEIPFPPSYPSYANVLVDQEGYLWVQEFVARDSSATGRQWSVFDPEGRWLGDLRLPARLILVDAAKDHILGIQTDEMGVEYVRVFPLVGRAR